MIWLTWRQFRAQAITGVAALAIFAILLAVTASRMSTLYAASGLTGCHGGACAGLASQFLTHLTSGQGVALLPAGSNAYVIVYFLSILVILIAPAITGIFWGAPLIARELETGTCRLAWGQSITRTRWLVTKLALTGLAAMAVTEAFSLIQAWWAAPIGKAIGFGGSASILTEGRFGPFVFATHGITPLGYAAFGFALGVAVGMLIRRPIPAMAVTLATFAVVQLVTSLWVRPHLLPASRTVATIAAAQASVIVAGVPIEAGQTSVTFSGRPPMAASAGVVPGQPGAWILSASFVSASGQPVSTLPAACKSAIASVEDQGGTAALDNCLTSRGIRLAENYQPLSRYWALQGAETGMFLALALALAWYCMWELNRRRT